MSTKRVFIAFAIKDEDLKIMFTGQAKNARVPYEFIDMSVKIPYDDEWKKKCGIKIKGCDGAIVLVSKNLKNSTGAKWEIDFIKDQKIPLMGIYIDGGTYADKTDNLNYVSCKSWTWDNVKEFIESL